MAFMSSVIRAAPGAAISGAVAYGVYNWAEKQCIKEGGNHNHPAAKILNATVAAGVGGLTYTPFALHSGLTSEFRGMTPGKTWAQNSRAAWAHMYKYPGGSIEAAVEHVMPRTTIGTAAAGASVVAAYEFGKHFFKASKPA